MQPRFGDLRKADAGSGEPLAPSCFGETIKGTLESTVRDGGYMSLLFHPFLEEQGDCFRVLREVPEGLQVLIEDGTVWCAPYRDVAPGFVGVPRRVRRRAPSRPH
jgi:hypothetical protein